MSAVSVQSELSSPEKSSTTHQTKWVCAGLMCVLALYCTMSCIGITWGLPSRKIDKFLFGEGEIWSGEKIYRLAHAAEKLSDARIVSTGADVDVNPVELAPGQPVPLTATDEGIAKIYLRYRLYTYQPDEMITMMALAGMRPGSLQLDPRLYQYGGLFIYPVGALIKLCGLVGLIDVRSDIVWYLDHPDEFGKFYVVARAYSAAWGLIGVIVVFALTRRFAAPFRATSEKVESSKFKIQREEGMRGNIAGLIAALLFTLMPVVVCMSHEGKPHLPGAVLMLVAVYFSVRAVDSAERLESTSNILTSKSEISNFKAQISNHAFFGLMCICCGAAVGMVLSSWPICVLIPLTAAFQYQSSNCEDRSVVYLARKTVVGGLAAVAVYFVTNPYVLINFLTNREVLRSNFGNSLAMYEISRIGEGFVRVLELTVEGATLPVVLLGVIALTIGLASFRRSKAFWLLAVPAVFFFIQFVLIGAGKPAEYGRFGIFTNSALVIGVGSLVSALGRTRAWGFRMLPPLTLIIWTGLWGLFYLKNFRTDSTDNNSRLVLARDIESGYYGPVDDFTVALLAEPAPYSCPPLRFDSRKVWLLPNLESTFPDLSKPKLVIQPWDHSISWANINFSTTRWMGKSQSF